MELEEYFADALEFGEALWEIGLAELQEKEHLREKIRHLSYLKKVRSFQKLPSTDQESKWLSAMRGDYFFNPAVPCKRGEYHPCTTYASGYHTHDYYELVFVIKGSYKQFVNGICYELQEGQIGFLPPGVLHREELQKWEDRILFCGISIEFFNRELCTRMNKQLLEILRFQKKHQILHQFYTFFAAENPNIQPLLFQMMSEDLHKEAGHHLIIRGYLIRLFKELNEHTEWKCFKQSRQETEDSLIQEILQYMEEHVSTVTKSELGEFFHFNSDYLGRFLLRKTGNTYLENLNNMRMEKAVQLLSSGFSVNSVIRQLGFSNKGHFNKMFKNFYGCARR